MRYKMLDLENKEVKEAIFDEFMGTDGTWTHEEVKECQDLCTYLVELDYSSYEWNYFLGQNSKGEHYLFRSKK